MDLVKWFLQKIPTSLFRSSCGDFSVVCYKVEHRGHSYYKLKKVLDNTGGQMKSSVYVNGVSNRRGVWRHNNECFAVFC
jgi:hypothetical protein